jgi:DNA-binding response OmpR family regulator
VGRSDNYCMRVLLIEDDKKISEYLSQGLKESGYIVDICLDGEEGFHYISTYQYELIILDLMLPKMDGLTWFKGSRSYSQC